MLEISKSALKAKLLEYLRRVEETGEDLVVTDNGHPVVKISALRAKISAADAFARVRGRVVYREDIMEPTTDEWPET
jgi:prevent-host-death family protein